MSRREIMKEREYGESTQVFLSGEERSKVSENNENFMEESDRITVEGAQPMLRNNKAQQVNKANNQ